VTVAEVHLELPDLDVHGAHLVEVDVGLVNGEVVLADGVGARTGENLHVRVDTGGHVPVDVQVDTRIAEADRGVAGRARAVVLGHLQPGGDVGTDGNARHGRRGDDRYRKDEHGKKCRKSFAHGCHSSL